MVMTMNNKFISNKLRFYPDRVADYINGKPANPITAQIQIIDKCCFKCFYCDKDIDSGTMISIDDQLINRLKELGVLSIILTGGEPLMHPDFDQMMITLSQHFKIGVVTTLYKYSEVLETIPTWVKISLDSVEPENYAKIKGVPPKMLSLVLKNMERLYQNKSDDMILGTQLVITEDNNTISQVEKIYARVKNFCDYLQLRPLEMLEDYSYSPETYQMLDYINTNYESVTISEKFYTNVIYEKCYAKWTQLLITTGSDVMICCNRVHEKVANLYDDDLLEQIRDQNLDMKKCYTPCVMSIYNQYIHNTINGEHKEFI